MNDQKFVFIFTWLSNTGKSKYIKFTTEFQGPMCKSLSEKAIMLQKSNSAHQDELRYALRGTKLAIMNETSEGDKLNEKATKQLAGGDIFVLRACGGTTEEFMPVTKSLFVTNVRISTTGNESIMDKLYHFEFKHKYNKSDKMDILHKIKILEISYFPFI